MLRTCQKCGKERQNLSVRTSTGKQRLRIMQTEIRYKGQGGKETDLSISR